MGLIITIANQKGGVGKTTTATTLAFGLRLKGYETLIIDLDPQRNASFTVGASTEKNTSLEMLKREITAREAIQKLPYTDCIPASADLSALDIVLTEIGKEYRLKEALEELKEIYDYIIIDTPPSLGMATFNAMTASDGIIIPTKVDEYSTMGIELLQEAITLIKAYSNPNLKVLGILRIEYDPRFVVSKAYAPILSEAAPVLGGKFYDTYIRRCEEIRKAQAERRSIFDFAPKCNAAEDYLSFIAEALSPQPVLRRVI